MIRSHKPEITAYIGLGSNLGDAAAQVWAAITSLQQMPDSQLSAQSPLFRSAPIDAKGADFINAVVQIQTQLPALILLQELQIIEHASGRERPYQNAPRTLDLDILLYGTQEITSDSLTVPHPRLTQRAFALIPLLQIDPMVVIPGQGFGHQFVAGVAAQKIERYFNT